MKRLLLDTNVLVRLLHPDPPEHHAAAAELFERGGRGELELVLKAVVVAETIYVLESFYRVDRRSIAGAIEPLLVLPGVVAEEQEILTASVRLYGKVKQGFADCYLAAAAGVEDAQVVTFDADLRKLTGARGLDPMETW